MSADAILEVDGLKKEFGQHIAVDDVSFSIERSGDMVGLIGPNGAGKTTLFNMITGIYDSTEGDVYFQGDPITDTPTHKIAELGLTRTFQDTRVLERLTLKENLLVASQVGKGHRDRANELLEIIELDDRAGDLARDLSFGQQKLVSIAQTLMLDPDMILLDEPFAGVNPTMENKIIEIVHEFLDRDKTFLLIEHDMDIIMEQCNDIIVMNAGEILTRDNPEGVQNNEQVIEAYFGTDDE
jgi:branched-chain amino acid transport system ATP-binding protein